VIEPNITTTGGLLAEVSITEDFFLKRVMPNNFIPDLPSFFVADGLFDNGNRNIFYCFVGKTLAYRIVDTKLP
jgi:hypothetical protein